MATGLSHPGLWALPLALAVAIGCAGRASAPQAAGRPAARTADGSTSARTRPRAPAAKPLGIAACDRCVRTYHCVAARYRGAIAAKLRQQIATLAGEWRWTMKYGKKARLGVAASCRRSLALLRGTFTKERFRGCFR